MTNSDFSTLMYPDTGTRSKVESTQYFTDTNNKR